MTMHHNYMGNCAIIYGYSFLLVKKESGLYNQNRRIRNGLLPVVLKKQKTKFNQSLVWMLQGVSSYVMLKF